MQKSRRKYKYGTLRSSTCPSYHILLELMYGLVVSGTLIMSNVPLQPPSRFNPTGQSPASLRDISTAFTIPSFYPRYSLHVSRSSKVVKASASSPQPSFGFSFPCLFHNFCRAVLENGQWLHTIPLITTCHVVILDTAYLHNRSTSTRAVLMSQRFAREDPPRIKMGIAPNIDDISDH